MNKKNQMESGLWLIASLHQITPEERQRNKGRFFDHPFAPAQVFHEASKYYPDLMSHQSPKAQYMVPDYPQQRTTNWIELPNREELPSLSEELGKTLLARRSLYHFGASIQFEELALLLTYALGTSKLKEVQDQQGKQYVLRLRTYPSGGALYPIEPWFYLKRVQGVETGVYRYSAFDHRLYRLDEIKIDQHSIASLIPGTDPDRNPLFFSEDFSGAAIICFLIADFTCQADKYGPRAYRLALLEAGHIAQNLVLTATALNMNSVPLAGFYDDRANQLLNLDGLERTLLYMLPIGKAKEDSLANA